MTLDNQATPCECYHERLHYLNRAAIYVTLIFFMVGSCNGPTAYLTIKRNFRTLTRRAFPGYPVRWVIRAGLIVRSLELVFMRITRTDRWGSSNGQVIGPRLRAEL